MRSADGGQPGRNTSTSTTRCTGRAVGSSAGTTSSRDARVERHVLDVGALAAAAATPIGLRIAGHVGGDRAVAERDERPRPLADVRRSGARSSSLRHGALDEADVDVGRVLLGVDERAVDDVGALGDLEQPLVHVEERHVAAGAAVEPDGGEASAWSSPARGSSSDRRYGQERPLRLAPSATDRPFSNSAPVGQTWTHLPQLVQVVDSPHGVPMSVTTRASTPRPITSQVWAPSISSQTRTQRVHRMQRLWSIANSGWLASTPTGGSMTGQLEVVEPERFGAGPAARSGCWRRRPRRCGCARRTASR